MTRASTSRLALVTAALLGVSLAAPALADFVATSPEVLGQTCTVAGKCSDPFVIDAIQDAAGKAIEIRSLKSVSNFDAAKGECRIDVKPTNPPNPDLTAFTRATYLQDQHGSMGKIFVDFVFFHCKQQ